MRLRRFYIGQYRVLHHLEIRFQPGYTDGEIENSYALDFLVGLNGSGKTAVLQAVGDVIRRLERSAPVPFPFELEYDLGVDTQQLKHILIRNRRIRTEDGAEETVDVQTFVNDEPALLTRDLLPNLVIVFTTGNEEEWLTAQTVSYEGHQDSSALSELSAEERALRELPGRPTRFEEEMESEREKSCFSLVRTSHLPLVILCGLLEYIASPGRDRTSILEKVLTETGLKRMCGFSLKFRMNEGIITEREKREIHRLGKYATRRLRLGSDRLLVYELSTGAQQTAGEVLKEFSGGFELLQTLSQMQQRLDPADNVLQEVNLFLERAADASKNTQENVPPLHLLSWLSDGEQSFIGRMSLFTLLGQQESLILLDEPEVHFNDYWKRYIVSLLDQTLKGQFNHVLITTHSSITLTDVPNEDIIVLNRYGAYTDTAGSPTIPTLAADPGDIMVHVFGTPFPSGDRAVSLILRELEEIGDEIGPEQRKRLEKLLEQVSPGYWSYRIRGALRGAEPI